MKRKPLLAILLMTCLASFAPIAQAQTNLVTNGDFSLGTIGAAPTSWTRTGATYFGVQSTPWTVSGGPTVTVAPSPNGGKIFVGQAYASNPANDTSISQMINGLVVGKTYNLSWYDAAVTTGGVVAGEQFVWNANIGGVSANSNIMGPIYNGWTANSMLFTATSTSELLAFTATGLTTGPTNLAIDGISITQVVPEPASGMLVMSAAALSILKRRRRQA